MQYCKRRKFCAVHIYSRISRRALHARKYYVSENKNHIRTHRIDWCENMTTRHASYGLMRENLAARKYLFYSMILLITDQSTQQVPQSPSTGLANKLHVTLHVRGWAHMTCNNMIRGVIMCTGQCTPLQKWNKY